MKRLRWLWFAGLYLFSWLLFGLVALLVNLVGLPLLPWAGRPGLARVVRRVLRGLFGLWSSWLHGVGVVRLTWRGFDGDLPAGCVYIANHPSLIDATVLLARIPNAVCILKPALMRNPAVGVIARLACYEPGDNMVDMVRRVAREVSEGGSLLVFPEGTRTPPGVELGRFRAGFALVAERSGAPVRLITLHCSPGLVPRDRAWWRPPGELPGWMDLGLGPELAPGRGQPASILGAAAEARLRSLLVSGDK